MAGSNRRGPALGAWPAIVSMTTVLLCGMPGRLEAQSTTNYDEMFARYLASARKDQSAGRVWMADLTSDPNARRVNDLITVRVSESLSATGSADSNVGKKSSGSVSLPVNPVTKYLEKIVPNSAETKFQGAGGTTRTTELSATLTARVTEVLPNGDLVVEGVHEIDLNGDRSLVVLSGVMRATDVEPGNVIDSSRIGQLRIRSLSRGLIQDSLQPGWLIRALNKVF